MDSLERLKELFRELFQLDVADLDFGLYRLFRLKRAEVEAFLDEQLPAEVDRAFEAATGAERGALERQVEEQAKQVRATVADDAILPHGEPNPQYANIKAVKEYMDARRRLEAVEASEAQRAEVFNLLHRFLSRYYDSGDFIPRRFYGARSAYAVPYNGEDVFFHWANKDQYYAKNGESFRDYAFTVATVSSEYNVRFRLVEATTPKDNTKGDTRFFFPQPKRLNFDQETRTCIVPFEYRLPTVAEVSKFGKNAKGQEAILDEAIPKILDAMPDVLLQVALAAPSPTGREGENPTGLLRRRLSHFTKKQTTDYFVHKNLGAFLRQELEFFIRDQVVHQLDLEGDFDAKRRTLRVFRLLADTVIAFLAQIEDAQKRLFEKNKFVLRTTYLIPIHHVPRSLWPEVLANQEQLSEWRELFGLEPKSDLFNMNGQVTEFVLEEHPTLVVDTGHFASDFTQRLLDAIDDLDEWTDGVLLHSENFQALSLMLARYREQAKCIYIDPPYNTASSSIPYKNDYKHSTFATLMSNRMAASHPLLRADGAIFVSIDKTERSIVEHVTSDVFGSDNRVEEVIWVMNTNNGQAPNYSTNHEYVLVYAKDRQTAEQDREMFREPKPGYAEVTELVAGLNPDYPPIAVVEAEIRSLYGRHRVEYREEVESQGLDWEDEKVNDPWKGLYNYDRAEYRDAEGAFVPESEAKACQARIWVWREDNISMPATKQAESTRDPSHKNYRFYRPLHPLTGKPCPHPKSGWKFAFEDDEDSPDRRSLVSHDRDNRIAWGTDETKVPQLKRFLHEVQSNVGKSVIVDYSDGEKQTSALFGRSGVFLAPKHSTFVARFIRHASKKDSLVLDYFAGSGSTGHAVIDLNREDGGRRKFILVEMADYFDTVLVPRIKKVMFTPEWKDGKPKRLVTRQEAERTPRLVKVLRLESYEDALHNTFSEENIDRVAKREKAYREVVGDEQYRVRYLVKLPMEASDSMLNLGKLEHPFDYTLEVLTDHGPQTETVDVVETFNWLYGLRVHRLLSWVNPQDTTEKEPAGRLYRAVVATDREDKKRILVVWRDTTNLDPVNDRAFLEAKAKEFGLFEEQWVNSDSAAKGFASLDGLFKRLMEEGVR